MLKKGKRKFSLHDITKMLPNFIKPYIITRYIDRMELINNIDKVNKYRKEIMPYAKPFLKD